MDRIVFLKDSLHGNIFFAIKNNIKIYILISEECYQAGLTSDIVERINIAANELNVTFISYNKDTLDEAYLKMDKLSVTLIENTFFAIKNNIKIYMLISEECYQAGLTSDIVERINIAANELNVTFISYNKDTLDEAYLKMDKLSVTLIFTPIMAKKEMDVFVAMSNLLYVGESEDTMVSYMYGAGKICLKYNDRHYLSYLSNIIPHIKDNKFYRKLCKKNDRAEIAEFFVQYEKHFKKFVKKYSRHRKKAAAI